MPHLRRLESIADEGKRRSKKEEIELPYSLLLSASWQKKALTAILSVH